jgi:hypothetical protein
VPWYLDLAAAAAVNVHVAANGLLTLSVTQDVEEQKTATQQDDTEQQARMCDLLAALLTNLAQQNPSVAPHLLQQVLPQLLCCQALADDASRLVRSTAHSSRSSSTTTSSPSNWVNLLCATTAKLHSQGHLDAVLVVESSIQQLEELTAGTQNHRAAGNALTLGHQACLLLLAAVLTPAVSAGSTFVGREAGSATVGNTAEQTRHTTAAAAGSPGLQPELLQRLLDCVVPCIAAGELII